MLVEISDRTLKRIKWFEEMDAGALSADEINELKKMARLTCQSLSFDVKHAERLAEIGDKS